jgi:hypothetical protein
MSAALKQIQAHKADSQRGNPYRRIVYVLALNDFAIYNTEAAVARSHAATLEEAMALRDQMEVSA